MRVTRATVRRLALGLLVLAGMGEVGIRLGEHFLVDGEVGALNAALEYHDDYWTLRPSSTLVQPERQGDVSYTSNQLGFRDRNHALDADARRIVFLGDSVTFGLGAREEVLFPRLLEQDLNRAAQGGERFEVINLALFGYAPANQLAVLRRYGLPVKPEVVVLQTYMNDFRANASAGMGAAPVDQSLAARLRTIKNVALNRSALYRRVRQLSQAFSFLVFHDLRRIYFAETLNATEPRAVSDSFRAHTEDDAFEGFRKLEEIAGIAEQFGLGFLVVLTPNEVQLFTDEFDLINERVRRFCVARDIPFHDPLADMRMAEGKEYLFVDGLHFNERGHRWMASYLLPRIGEHLAPTRRTGEPIRTGRRSEGLPRSSRG